MSKPKYKVGEEYITIIGTILTICDWDTFVSLGRYVLPFEYYQDYVFFAHNSESGRYECFGQRVVDWYRLRKLSKLEKAMK